MIMNKIENINFESLVEYIMQLSDAEKNILMNVLKVKHLSLVNEQVATYSKTIVEKVDFEQKWNESLNVEQFREGTIQHINNLPWKQL